AKAGPYAPAAGQIGSTAIPANSPNIVAWASSVTRLERGPQSIADPSLGSATFGNGVNALGVADTSGVVSLRSGPGIEFPLFAQLAPISRLPLWVGIQRAAGIRSVV
ncbi:MAG: hypothetical protein HC802_22660, partial [Caldilineaceae bacterium]|nr:hypothetical protein [Caldilineaceae bacterium]